MKIELKKFGDILISRPAEKEAYLIKNVDKECKNIKLLNIENTSVQATLKTLRDCSYFNINFYLYVN